ncbi:MAG: 2-oxo acid dehydrogenase subunit E2 [Chloroflexi bacterium]|nr:2-oxo acid dehydrogenase subunit E2 [Chloroflexota bacterium]
MPQLGFDMRQGTVVRWLKQPGDIVAKGEPLLEVETDKAVVEVEAFASGVLGQIVVGEGQTAPVGQVIGLIAAPGEAVAPVAAAAKPAAALAGAPLPSVPAPAPAAAPPPTDGRTRASPLARRLAEEHGIDLAQLVGSGPGGRVVREDVEKAVAQKAKAPVAEAPKAAPAVPTPAVAALSPMRQAIARRMAQSKREAPHFYLSMDMDMTEAQRLRRQLNEALGDDSHVSINDMIVKAAALALAKFPYMNASYTENGVVRHEKINVGVAIALDDGLIAPAVVDCGAKGLVQIARETRDLAERAKGGKLKPEEYAGPTFTVSNLGMYEVEKFIAIISPPQAAILAVGAVRQRPVVRDGQIVVAEMMTATLSSDHRVTDGAQAARFLAEVKRLLEHPVALLV